MNIFLLFNIIFTALNIFIIIYAYSLQFFPKEWRNKIKQDSLVGLTIIFLTMLTGLLWIFYFYFLIFYGK